jgi:ribosome production factor 2
MSFEKLAVKSKRGLRSLAARESKVNENTKKCLVLKGNKTSQVTKSAQSELASLFHPPQVKKLSKMNQGMHPFEDQSSLEFLCEKNDCSLFMLASKSKKRPHALTLGRCFDWQVLDMYEFSLLENSFLSMKDIQKNMVLKPVLHLGSKPLLLFNGEEFDSDPEMMSLKNFFAGKSLSYVLRYVDFSFRFF